MRRLALLTTALTCGLCALAHADGPGADGVVWADWLNEAEVWRVVEQASGAEPAELPQDESASLRALPPTQIVETLPAVVTAPPRNASGRVVRYEVPLADIATHQAFAARGVRGELISVPIKAGADADSTVGKYSTRVAAFFVGDEATPGPDDEILVRYDAPAEDIALHTQFAPLGGELIEAGGMRLPEVRFFQPKARIYSDLKRDNDEEFDLFANGSLLASLDIVELYFPMPLVSERLAYSLGRPSPLSGLGWRVGGTVGIGITTALSNGDEAASGAPISTVSAGIRYDFPLGRLSPEVLATGDGRLDERTRVGIEGGVQGGYSTDESLSDSTDLGVYLGILVNTPW